MARSRRARRKTDWNGVGAASYTSAVGSLTARELWNLEDGWTPNSTLLRVLLTLQWGIALDDSDDSFFGWLAYGLMCSAETPADDPSTDAGLQSEHWITTGFHVLDMPSQLVGSSTVGGTGGPILAGQWLTSEVTRIDTMAKRKMQDPCRIWLMTKPIVWTTDQSITSKVYVGGRILVTL